MSAGKARWEYRIVTIDDDIKEVNASMHKWADAGWELVSGAASSWVSKGYEEDLKTWHTRYTMYWRKPVDNK